MRITPDTSALKAVGAGKFVYDEGERGSLGRASGLPYAACGMVGLRCDGRARWDNIVPLRLRGAD